MDNNSCSFFSFQQEEELMSIPCPDFTIWDVGVDDNISFSGIHLQNINKNESKGKSTSNLKLQKKIIHREIEKQRRQEMATLYASLRSVLPPQYLKGKRSISDQIDGAVKYIRCLPNNIRLLGIKRDNMKRLICTNENGNSSKILPVVVTVQTCSIGVEILISGDFMAEGLNLPLSRILKMLLEEGLIVVCCNCTKDSDGRLHYMINPRFSIIVVLIIKCCRESWFA